MSNEGETRKAPAESKHRKSRIDSLKIWLIPILAVILVFVFGAFVRLLVGTTDQQDIDYGTKPFVPGESPYSTGRDSR